MEGVATECTQNQSLVESGENMVSSENTALTQAHLGELELRELNHRDLESLQRVSEHLILVPQEAQLPKYKPALHAPPPTFQKHMLVSS